jgi:hypothetical protein
MLHDNDGHWIASGEKYQRLATDLSRSDPRLFRADKKTDWPTSRWSERDVKATILEIEEGSRVVKSRLEFDTVDELKECMTYPKGATVLNTVWILEGANRDLVGFLGDHLDIHPSMFVEYERTAQAASPERDDASVLASSWATREHLCIGYRELLRLPASAQSHFGLRCSHTGRNISVTRINSEFDGIGVAYRKCILWKRPRRTTKGWDCTFSLLLYTRP